MAYITDHSIVCIVCVTRERGSRTSHRDDADLIEYLPDVWLLPRRYRSGRLEPRCARPADGGIAPLHRCHPLSLAGPSCRHAISRPSGDLGLQITRPRTLCAGPRPRGEFWPAWLDRFSSSRWTRCALASGGDAGHVVVDIRLAKQCRAGVLLR